MYYINPLVPVPEIIVFEHLCFLPLAFLVISSILDCTVCCYHVAFLSGYTPDSCLNVKELLARNRGDI